jgi:DNA repair exonuclease SbcCD ATPase subunit
MGYRNQSGPRQGSGQRFQKSSHEKAKPKPQKNRSGIKYAEDESQLSAEEITEKTLGSLTRLGGQTFALSPFSQYYDDWLVNLRQVISEFESNPSVKVDDAFAKERTQIFSDVEGELAKRRLRDDELETTARQLAENNHLLVETDTTYATQTRENATKRNHEIEQLTENVHDCEQEISKIQQMRTRLFGFTRKAKRKKLEEANQKLNAAKNELQLTVQNFTVEQEKLHDEYEKKKQATIEIVQKLEKEITDIETDRSAEPRQTAATALATAVKSLLQRQTPQTQ